MQPAFAQVSIPDDAASTVKGGRALRPRERGGGVLLAALTSCSVSAREHDTSSNKCSGKKLLDGHLWLRDNVKTWYLWRAARRSCFDTCQLTADLVSHHGVASAADGES
jgi:hypothetical protein